MEFSEIFELNRIAKCIQLFKPKNKMQKLKSKTLAVNRESSPSMQLSLKSSPDSLQCSMNSEKSPAKHLPLLDFEKDNSYLYSPSVLRRSSLTESLLEISDTKFLSPLNQLVIEVYFFRSLNKLKLVLPMDITVSDLLIKALQAYSNMNFSRLPYGLDSNGYELWVSEDENHLPDTDYILNKRSKVSTLGVSILCLCEKKGYIDRSSYKISKSIINRHGKDRLLIKFYFEGAWSHLAVEINLKLSDVLVLLMKKFAIVGKASEREFEFRIFIRDTCEECPVDMGLYIRELNTNDIRLYRKKYADAPPLLKKHKKRNA